MLLFLHISIGYPSDSYKIHNGALQQNLHLSSEQDKEYSKTVEPHGFIVAQALGTPEVRFHTGLTSLWSH